MVIESFAQHAASITEKFVGNEIGFTPTLGALLALTIAGGLWGAIAAGRFLINRAEHTATPREKLRRSS